METSNKITYIKMLENGNGLYKIEAIIYHKSLVEMVFPRLLMFGR